MPIHIIYIMYIYIYIYMCLYILHTLYIACEQHTHGCRSASRAQPRRSRARARSRGSCCGRWCGAPPRPGMT